MKLVQWTLSWICYLIGHCWWRVAKGLGNWFEWPYVFYNRLMGWSCQIQGNSNFGPWKLAKEDAASTNASAARKENLK
jgi:hypothetical protein